VGLTEREREILQLVSDGESNADVARKLWITEQTVKFHLSNVYRKLDVSNRTQASRRAQQLKLVKLDDARAEAG
jgi:DNA-binding CsgD family transcriptional regulator